MTTTSNSSIMIDAYAHISPPKYTEFLIKKYPAASKALFRAHEVSEKADGSVALGNAPIYDLEQRFRVMDAYEGLVQVLTIGPVPPIEEFANPQQAVELAKMANNEMAELLVKYRDRFVAAIAQLPMNDPEASLKEAERAINDLGFRGIYVHSNINGKPLDAPEFLPLFGMMAKYNLPIYIHPWRSDTFGEYATEKSSKYGIAGTFGWPYETTAAMTRIVFSGIFEKYPDLKIVTHHCGGMVPFFQERIYQHYTSGSNYVRALKEEPLEYYKKFYYDTAIHGNTYGLMSAYELCGADRLIFGADMPLGDRYRGLRSYRQTINAINAMNITPQEKRKVMVDNALSLLRIPL
jgi:predicted TIM-barrel fold metal-dependent hydrolase